MNGYEKRADGHVLDKLQKRDRRLTETLQEMGARLPMQNPEFYGAA